MSRSLKLGAGIAVSALCVWLSMRDVRPGEVWAALRQSNGLLFMAAAALTIVGFWIRALRWRSLLATPQPLGMPSLFGATMIGFMANNLLPFRLGEFVRAWALARRERMSKTTVFATVVVERVVDMLTLVAILGVSMLIHPMTSGSRAEELTRAGATALIVTCIALTVFVIVLERKPARVHALVERLSGLLPHAHRHRGGAMLGNFVEGLGLFRDLPRLAWVFLLSFAMFGGVVLGLQASMHALDIRLPWYAGLTMLVITAIGIMVPAAPGYIGTMNVACVAGLALFGVDKPLSVPFSWFYWASQWIPVTLVGLWYLRREGLSLASLGRASEGGDA